MCIFPAVALADAQMNIAYSDFINVEEKGMLVMLSFSTSLMFAIQCLCGACALFNILLQLRGNLALHRAA